MATKVTVAQRRRAFSQKVLTIVFSFLMNLVLIFNKNNVVRESLEVQVFEVALLSGVVK